MHTRQQNIVPVSVAAVTALVLLAGCGKPAASNWMQITQGDPCAAAIRPPPAADAPDDAPPAACDEPAFYLDAANLSVRSGTPYVILQTRYTDGRVGSIRAEANCPRKKLEPTALKEDLFQANGTLLENRMRAISAADEQAVLAYACSKR